MKRIFFGLEIEAPWPEHFPKGRLIEQRHLTLAFLGNVEEVPPLVDIPLPSFSIGPAGFFDKLLFLPPDEARVAALHVHWLFGGKDVENYQKSLLDWLENLSYRVDRRPLLSHVTLARAPFEKGEWETSFAPLPCMASALHLYESVGNLHYESLWKFALKPPFEEIEHTADIAFIIHATTIQQLYIHAALALSFKFPPLLQFFTEEQVMDLNETVRALNQLIARADQKIGCPFKAVSYSGAFINNRWQMVVDV